MSKDNFVTKTVLRSPDQTTAARLLKIAHPIVQGPFGGGASSVELTAAVSNLGGLGSFGAHIFTPQQIKDIIARIREQTEAPFALNLWVNNADAKMAEFDSRSFDSQVERLLPYYSALGLDSPRDPDCFGQNFDEQVEALVEAGPPVFSFVFGIPSQRILESCRSRGILTMGNATTVEEARAIEAAGVDIVVATGSDAGGHRVSFLQSAETSLMGTFALIPQVRDAVSIPVIAAGGIADGRGVAAALTLGADGVQIGTAFLACKESGANPWHRSALFSLEARQTMLTRAYSGRLARVIRNHFSERMSMDANVAPYPAQNWFTNTLSQSAIEQGRGDLLWFQAGQSASLLRHHAVAELFQSLVLETEEAFRSAATRSSY
jgi:nitronate monooxygenase